MIESTDKSLIDSGYIKIDGLDNLFDKVDLVISELGTVAFQPHPEISKIIVEDFLKSYAGGKTTANTLIKLSAVNYMIRYSLLNIYNVPIESVHPATARVKAWGRARIKGMDTKKFVMQEVQQAYPEIVFEMNRTGTDYKVGSYDQADAVTLART